MISIGRPNSRCSETVCDVCSRLACSAQASAEAYCSSDEFENAIHTELLMEFTRLVQALAVELNVQVFLSTHSKEAIDAFVLNGYRTDDIVGYAISRTGDGVTARRYDGSRLQSLHEAVDFDLRGMR